MKRPYLRSGLIDEYWDKIGQLAKKHGLKVIYQENLMGWSWWTLSKTWLPAWLASIPLISSGHDIVSFDGLSGDVNLLDECFEDIAVELEELIGEYEKRKSELKKVG